VADLGLLLVGEVFDAVPELDRVLGNEEKLRAESWQPGDGPRVAGADIMKVKAATPHLIDGLKERTRAFVQVQNGCDHRCTFCIIPYGRGNSRSVPMGAVVDQVRELAASGYAEVVLTGVDATSYGGDLPGAPSLGLLAKTILKQVPEIRRLRLSSIDSIEADRHLMDLMAEETRFMPHLHLSLQHGDDMILKRMKRRHSRADALAFCADVRRLRPDMAFGADIIAGFPTETEAAFANSLSLAEEIGIAHLHVFPFSPREGTPASRMPQLDRRLVKERAARLRETGEALHRAHLSAMAGTRQIVLAERGGLAHTENFTSVRTPDMAPGTFAEVTISGHDGKHLIFDTIAAHAA